MAHVTYEHAVRGFLLSLGLILALGPQNLFVVRMGAERRLRTIAIGMCSLCDVVLIALGLLGVGAALSRFPSCAFIIGFLGSALLLLTGGKQLIGAVIRFLPAQRTSQEAGSPAGGSYRAEHSPHAPRQVAWAALGFSLLNPHALLDTLVILGGAGAHYSGTERLAFGIGASAASCLWFTVLGHLGGRLLKAADRRGYTPLFDAVSGVILVIFGFGLLGSLAAT